MSAYSLRDYYQAEILRSDKPFSWWQVLKKAWRNNRKNYLFWFRLADVIRHKGRFCKSLAKSINKRISRRYGVEIMLGAEIAPGLTLPHPTGIIITKKTKAGRNFMVLQGTTIGFNRSDGEPIVFGDNVSIGANAIIMGPGLTIGSNVEIGAMSFVNRDIPSHSVFYTRKESVILEKSDR